MSPARTLWIINFNHLADLIQFDVSYVDIDLRICIWRIFGHSGADSAAEGTFRRRCQSIQSEIHIQIRWWNFLDFLVLNWELTSRLLLGCRWFSSWHRRAEMPWCLIRNCWLFCGSTGRVELTNVIRAELRLGYPSGNAGYRIMIFKWFIATFNRAKV